MYKIWFKFNSYTGNFEREFVAFMFGYEGEYDQGDYQEYVSNFNKNGQALNSIIKKLKFTVQEVDDYCEETFYNIAPYKNENSQCNAIYIQLCEPITKEEFSSLIKRAQAFGPFLEKTSAYTHLNGISVIDGCLTKETTTQEKIM